MASFQIKAVGLLDTTRMQQAMDNFQKKNANINFGKTISKNTQEAASGFANATKSSKGFFDTLRNVNSIINVMQGLFTVIKSVTSSVFELDSALTEYKKVSDLSGSSLDQFTEKASNLGNTVARTTAQMIQASAEFKKSGYTDEDSLRLAQVAEMYANVADSELSAGDAASYIISQMKAFNISASDATSIIDKTNEVSNNFAVSSTDISNALTKSSSALATYGNTMDQTIGLKLLGLLKQL